MIAAIVPFLLSKGYELSFDVARDAKKILPQSNIFKIEQANIALCGYDDPFVDDTGRFLRTAAECRVPVLGMLDSWKGLDRFWYKDGSIRRLPKKLVILDQIIAEYLINRGLPKSMLVVAGHPGLEEYAKFSFTEKNIFRIEGRAKLGISEEDQVMLLLSEPLRLPNGRRRSLLEQKTVYGPSLGEWLHNTFSCQYSMLARLHPIEVAEIPFGWKDAGRISLAQALCASDRIVGLASTSLAYAVAAKLSVHCLDQDVHGWSPEFSDIPLEIWSKLVESAVFQNSRLQSCSAQPRQAKKSAESIVSVLTEIAEIF